MMAAGGKKVLIIGGSRFSGLYLFKELHERVSYGRKGIDDGVRQC